VREAAAGGCASVQPPAAAFFVGQRPIRPSVGRSAGDECRVGRGAHQQEAEHETDRYLLAFLCITGMVLLAQRRGPLGVAGGIAKLAGDRFAVCSPVGGTAASSPTA